MLGFRTKLPLQDNEQGIHASPFVAVVLAEVKVKMTRGGWNNLPAHLGNEWKSLFIFHYRCDLY